MSLTKVSYSMINGAPANILDFGADPTGVNDSTSAMRSAIAASSAVYIPEGIFKITDTIHIDRNGVNVFGSGNGSVINFSPTVSPTNLFLIQAANPANLIQYVNFNDFGVKATTPSDIIKRAFVFSDASHIIVNNVNTLDYSWVDTSGTSFFFLFAGRDQHTISNCSIGADFPIYVTKNPNSAVYQFDVFSFENLSLQTLNPDNYAITFEAGVNISQWTMLGRNVALQGKGGIYFNDTETGTSVSSMILIDSFRVESGTASGGSAGGYGIYMNFGSGNPYCGNITIRNSSVNDPTCNGYSFNHVAALEVQNINCGAGSVNNAFILQNVLNAQITSLGILNNSATVLFNNMYAEYVSKPAETFVNPSNPSIAFGLYTHYDSDTPNRNLVYQNNVRTWQRNESINNGGSIALPTITNGGSMLVNVSCNFGYGLYYVNYAGATLISGTAGFGVSGSGNISLVTATGVSTLYNASAGGQQFIITTSGA